MSSRFTRPALAAFLVAASSVISGCSLMMDFSDPIPAEDAFVADTALETSVETSIDSGLDTEAPDTALPDTELADTTEVGVDAMETSVDADDAADTADTATGDTADSALDDTADSAMDDTMDASDSADVSDTADTSMCSLPTDCPDPGNECITRTCTSGVCGVSPRADGFAVSMQTAGDCKKVVCDGAGATKTVEDDTDVQNDGKQCTTDRCTMGVAFHDNVLTGTTCTESGGKVCDGAGACVECVSTTDCTPPQVCNTTSHTCVAPSCTDLVKNGTETDVDCGGTCTTKCALTKDCAIAADCASNHCVGSKCVECETGTDCTSGVCTGNACAAATCSDMLKNGSETDVDCGGTCPDCGLGRTCAVDGDCASTHCVGLTCVQCTSGTECPSGVCTSNACAAATCSDMLKNGSETDVDCGGGTCPDCALAKTCAGDSDCLSNHCVGLTCVECTSGSECPSSVCTGNACAAASCTDLTKNGTETDVDCGGTVCTTKCTLGKTCGIDADCASAHCVGLVCVECTSGTECPSGVCTGNACAAATCSDLVKNGTETAIDCGGSCTKDCEVGQACATGPDCESGICTSLLCASPAVLSTSPADGATNINTETKISITFAGPMSGTSLTVQSSAGACTGAVQVSTDDFATCIGLDSLAMTAGDTVATLTPTTSLSMGSTYKIRVTTAATDGSGNPLGAQYTSTTGFTTSTTCSSDVVISQIYGGAGSTGAPYDRDFIELHNRGTSPINIDGWAVQYASAAGTSWSRTLLTGTIPAGGYYLIGEATGAGTTPLPAADASGGLNLSGTAGKVALTSNSVTLTGSCPTGGALVDLVGFGSTANCYEGTGPTPAPSATLSAQRKASGCTDTTNNASDFESAAPAPRNTSSTAVTCSACSTVNEKGVSSEADYCVLQFPTTEQTVTAGTATSLIYGRIYENGVTDPAGASLSVTAQVGYGPDTVNPSTQSGWTWSPAVFNAQFGNDDEYQSVITAPLTPGKYRFGYRFSLDSGTTWTYCDTNGAGSNGGLTFETTKLPVLTVTSP